MAATNLIPKKIHQTWKDENIPEHYRPLIQTWKDNQPTWDYVLWTDKTNREFIMEFYPGFLSIYDSYPYEIQRVDAVRYFILYHFGGLFVDMDFECLKKIDVLLKNRSCVFGLEPAGHNNIHNKDIIVCNAFMASVPSHDFLKAICDYLTKNDRQFDKLPKALSVLYSTGPFMLTELYKSYAQKNEVFLIDSEILYPLTIHETRELIFAEEPSDSIKSKLLKAKALHYFLGSWW